MVGLDYGYRSRCCYAPIRLGKKNVKGSRQKISIWVCTKCLRRDVPIIEYNKEQGIGTTPVIKDTESFIPDDPDI